MRNPGSKLFVAAIIAVIVLALGYAFWPQPVSVDLVKVGRGTVRVTVDEDGKTRIKEKYVVSAPLNGRILRVSLDPGDEVVAGKTLLTMIEPRDPDLLDPRALAQAEARVKAAEAALRQVEPKLVEARDRQSFAEAEVARMRHAFGGKGVSQSELDNAEFAYRQASEELRATRVSEEIARFELEQAQAALLRSKPHADEPPEPTAIQVASTDVHDPVAGDGDGPQPKENVVGNKENNGWNFPIYSPINGKVLRVFQESSAVVMPGTQLVELGDPKDLEVEIDVLSRDAVRIHPRDLVLLEHWGGEKPLEGRVRTVEPSGFMKISTLGVEEQRVWVIVDLVDPPERRPTLGDGYRVEARIVIDEARDVLKIPTSALFRAADKYAVFRVENGVAHQQPIDVGRQNGLEAEVREGLSEADEIVLHPSDQIADGVKVRQR
jgi:HlyD family secretion protein